MSPTLWFFASTLFVSAFLLFLVQPMISKMILPTLGGTPQVWNTCVVFFQTALLAGYAYTHSVSAKLKLHQQLTIHGLLLLVPAAVLFVPLVVFGSGRPFDINLIGPPPFGANPIPWTLLLLTLVVGIPFFVASTSAPLLQKWFTATGDPAAKDPYFLYGASNIGSLLALLMYPVIVEPHLTLNNQAWTWSIAYLLFAGLVFGCALMVWKAPPQAQLALAGTPEAPPLPMEHVPEKPSEQVKPGPAPATTSPQHIRKGLKGARGHRPAASVAGPTSSGPRLFTLPETRSDVLTWPRRLRWIGLAAVPCSLMLGVTTYMSTDVSAIPMFWVIPLALYLVTFILVFAQNCLPSLAAFATFCLVFFVTQLLRAASYDVGMGLALACATAVAILVQRTNVRVPWLGTPHTLTLIVQPFALLALLFIVATGRISPIWMTTLILLLGFFLTTLVCHGELARDRPSPKHLTEFYLWMSVGGMLGGMLNGLVAPVLFFGLAELPIAIALSCFLRPVLGRGGWFDSWMARSFPGLADQPTEATAQPSLLKTEGGQSFNVLKGSLDVALPLAVGILMALIMFNQDAVWSGLGTIGHKWLGMGEMRRGSWTHWFTSNGLMILTYGVPILFAFMFSHRPVRFGLAVGLFFAINSYHDYVAQSERVLSRSRSYFGILRVLETKEDSGDGLPVSEKEAEQMNASWTGEAKLKAKAGQPAPYHYLMHGTTHHGLNFQSPQGLRRLATTYYHRFGPTGRVMEKLNWWGGKTFEDQVATQNSYHADARMPAHLLAAGFSALGTSGSAEQLVALWSEPPYATIGLGTGTMASYGRPFQVMHFYEIDHQILNYNLPAGSLEENLLLLKSDPDNFGDPRKQPFNYLTDAIRRGVNLEVMMGDARLRMGMPYVTLEDARVKMGKDEAEFYAQTAEGRALRHKARELSGGPDGFYRAIEVDAFSSDAIPVHLITQEAIEIYFKKSMVDGVVMVHTSNRHVDLVSPVTDIAKDLGKLWRHGEDTGRSSRENLQGRIARKGTGLRGHFQSQYVMLANKCKEVDETGKARPEHYYLPPATADDDISGLHWDTPRNPGNRIWTDDYSNLLSVFRW